MPAPKRKKTKQSSLEAAWDAFTQALKKRKRHTPGRVFGRAMVKRLKKDPLVTLIALALAGAGAWYLLGQWAVAGAGGLVVFLVLCEAWPEIARWAWVHRRMLGPFVAAALMVIPELLVVRSPRAAAFVGLLGLVFVGYSWLNLRLRRREHSHARGYIPQQWLPMTLLATGWTVLAAKYGLTRPVLGVLLVGWLLWAVRWWFVNRTRGGHQLPLEKKWAATIANPDYEHLNPSDKLLGSRLVNVRSVPGGMAATVVLPEGQRGSRVDGLIEVIASIYGIEVVDVTVDQSTRANQRELFVLPKSPLRKPHRWKGSDLDFTTWVSTIGSYIDGMRVQYVWCIPDSGPWHDLISGTTRAGKSRLLDLLLATSRAAKGYIVDWVIDPQNGQSLPDWQDEVDWFASSVEEGLRMLRAARAVMFARNRILSRKEYVDRRGRTRKGIKGFTPSLEMPLLVLTIDEAHALLKNPEAVVILAEMGKMAAKCGIKVRLVTHLPLLSELGNSSVLRDMVASGNVIVLRTASRITGQVAFQGALVVDPVSIPRRMPDGSSSGGLGFALGAESRQAPMRLDWIEDPIDAAVGPIWRLGTDEAATAGGDYARRNHEDVDDEDVIEGEVIAEGPAEDEPATTDGVVVRGPGGITCADRFIQIVRAANGDRVSRSKVAEQLLGTWKLQMITKTIKEVCEDPTKPVWSDDQRTTVYFKEAS